MNRKIITYLIAVLISFLFFGNISADTYFYDAKYIGQRIYLESANDEIMVKFIDNLTEDAVNAIMAAMELDIITIDLDNLKYARMNVLNPGSFEDIVYYLSHHGNIKYVMPVLIDQYGARRKFVPGQLTVRFIDGLTQNEMIEIIESQGCTIIKEHYTNGYYTIEAPEGSDYFYIIRRFVSMPEVLFSEPDYLVSDCGSSEDEFFNQQWNLKNTGQFGGNPGADINIEPAWEITIGSPNIWIAPLESGFNLSHEDLYMRYELGMDFTKYPPEIVQDSPNAEHSSRICGILGARKDNGVGIAGIAPGSRIFAVACNITWPHDGDCDTDVALTEKVDALYYVAEQVGNNNDRIVVTMSWSIIDTDYDCLAEAIYDVYRANCVLVSSTGNYSGQKLSYPAKYDEVIGVGATTHNDFKAGYSNYGTLSGVEVAAPVGADGEEIIISTGIGVDGYTSGSGYQGTSFSAPQVAGLAALILSLDPTLSVEQVRSIIDITADKVGGYDYDIDPSKPGWSEELGYGRINAYTAVLCAKYNVQQFLTGDISGSITQNTLIYGDVHVIGDLVVNSGVTLIIKPGTVMKFDSGKKMTVYGILIAEGRSSNLITFTSANGTPSPGDWQGLILDGATSNSILNYTDIRYGKINVEIIDCSPQITNSTIKKAQYQGIKLNNSEPDIKYCTIQDNNSYGIFAINSYSPDYSSRNFVGNTIRDNYHGILLSNSSPSMEDNYISSNSWYGIFGLSESNPVLSENHVLSNTKHGTRWYNSSSPYIYNKSSYDFGGCNDIINNGNDGVYASGSSYPKIGYSSSYPGNNNIYNNTDYEVSNHNSGSTYIWARYNWWGSEGPDPGDFYGLVYFLPYLPDECGLALASSGDPQTVEVENSASYFNDVGVELYGNGQIDAAIKMFTHVMDNFPDSEGARFALQQVIAIMQERGQNNQILPFLSELSFRNKGNSLGWYADLQRVFILEHAGKHEEAFQLIESVLQESTIEPEIKYPTALYRAMILSDGLHQEQVAIQAYRDFLFSSPPEDLALIAEAELERLTGRPSVAGRSIVAQPSAFPLPKQFRLLQNYPNPFNALTTIQFELPEDSFVELRIYDLIGREIKTLIRGNENAGVKNVLWNGKDNSGRIVSSGVYLYHLSVNSLESDSRFTQTRKMVYLQ